jgi:hypothetical protein
MNQRLSRAGVVVGALALSTLSIVGIGRPVEVAAVTDSTWNLDDYGPRSSDNVVLKWNEQLLETIRKNPGGTGPTITARALGVVHTSMYDAWAAYDPVAKRTRASGVPRQPTAERTLANKSKAISFAAYKTLLDLFPNRKSDYDAQMVALGYAVDGTDASMAATVGNAAAQANIDYRHVDGSNQTLDTKGTANPSDDTVNYPYVCPPAPNATCYSPTNQWNNVTDRWRWQPLCVLTTAGVQAGKPTTPADGICTGPNYGVQPPLTPQWRYVKPFALLSALQYKVPGPPKNPDGTYSTADIEREYQEASNLSDIEKAKAEYWADGPGSVFPPGHDMIFAQALSRKRGHSLDTDVKMFFALGNAMLDASVAAWAQKYIHDYVRPITAIREHYKGQQITSWKGPNQGFGPVPAEQWMPYQALHVVTPPFPEYVSGHSTFSGAGAKVLLGFAGSDTFNARVTIPAGSSAFEPGTTPSADVTLAWPTFTAAADEAGMSRRYGGIHFYGGDTHGRMLGHSVGSNAWSKAQSYIKGYSGYNS